MTIEVKLPQWGMAMSEGTVVTWLVAEGDEVTEGQELVEVDAEKSVGVVPSPSDGRIGRILAAENETVEVNAVLCVIEPPGGAPVPVDGGNLTAQDAPVNPTDTGLVAVADAVPAEEQAVPAREHVVAHRREIAPRARKLARDQGVDIESVTGTGPGGRVLVVDVENALAQVPPTPPMVPLVRKAIDDAGLDASEITGSGPHGRIRMEDVQAAKAASGAETEQAAMSPQGAASKPTVRGPSSAMRRTIARRMYESLQTTAQFTMTTTADVTDLMNYRAGLQQRPTITDFVVRACALALKQHPDITVTFADEKIHLASGIHIGVAVAVDGGLLVPVVRNADRLGLAELAGHTADLVARARAGSLRVNELSGGTFSVTSLGGQGIDTFTPVLNPPESAILGVGRVRDVATRFGNEVVWRSELGLSLTVDHRAIDGYPGALFLATVVENLAQPHALT